MRYAPVTASMVLAALMTSSAAAQTVDTAAIDGVLGRAGQMQEGVYKVTFPRTDLAVSVDGVPIRPGLALGAWVAFRRATADSITHGDLALAEHEINPVITTLQQGGIEITALHNHLLRTSPTVMFLHFWGRGDAVALAKTIRAAIEQTKTPIAPLAAGEPEDTPWARAVQAALGRNGAVRGGVLSIGVPRPEKVTMHSVELPSSMGMATALNFQDAGGGNVAATGDFVLVADEVNGVARALRDGGAEVTALHSHIMDATPVLYFMHFWIVAPPEKAGATLKQALQLVGRARQGG